MDITLQGLTKVFTDNKKGKGGQVTPVDHFDFAIPSGKLIGLLGPSGCGKSTALHLISGLHTPTEGRIFFGDEDVTSLPAEKRGVGVVFQHYALYPHLTVMENILFPLENLEGKDRLPKDEMVKRAKNVARMVQLDALLGRRPKELSGGQQQRVAIARALVKHPKVLLMDEPLSNLDARLRLQTREEIRRIQRKAGVTTIFVTHDQEEAMSISDEIVVMKEGKIQQIAPPQTVYDNPANLFVAQFLGTPPINVFRGRVQEGKLMLGGDAVGMLPLQKDGDVIVGIRPEGVIPDAAGPLLGRMDECKSMGREEHVYFTHEAVTGDRVHALVEDPGSLPKAGEVRFSIKPGKMYLFDAQTHQRLYWEIK